MFDEVPQVQPGRRLRCAAERLSPVLGDDNPIPRIFDAVRKPSDVAVLFPKSVGVSAGRQTLCPDQPKHVLCLAGVQQVVEMANQIGIPFAIRLTLFGEPVPS